MALMRIEKIIADSKPFSRSEAVTLIKSGRVSIDGVTVLKAGTKADPEISHIEIDGVRISYKEHRYFMMNKPQGVISATEAPYEKTVLELMGAEHGKLGIFPVGRLDKDAEGLLLLTDDGDFSHRVTSPRKNIKKTYYVKVRGKLSEAHAEEVEAGITLEDGTSCLPGELHVISAGETSEAYVTISEGKYHQVKRMMASLGTRVVYLRRLSIGGLKLDESLRAGEYRELEQDEISAVFNKNYDILHDDYKFDG